MSVKKDEVVNSIDEDIAHFDKRHVKVKYHEDQKVGSSEDLKAERKTAESLTQEDFYNHQNSVDDAREEISKITHGSNHGIKLKVISPASNSDS